MLDPALIELNLFQRDGFVSRESRKVCCIRMRREGSQIPWAHFDHRSSFPWRMRYEDHYYYFLKKIPSFLLWVHVGAFVQLNGCALCI